VKGELPFLSPCVVGHEITGEVVDHGLALLTCDHFYAPSLLSHLTCAYNQADGR
jgi:threonine dehydrogenase-like Zn-dependent dehydrogenase